MTASKGSIIINENNSDFVFQFLKSQFDEVYYYDKDLLNLYKKEFIIYMDYIILYFDNLYNKFKNTNQFKNKILRIYILFDLLNSVLIRILNSLTKYIIIDLVIITKFYYQDLYCFEDNNEYIEEEEKERDNLLKICKKHLKRFYNKDFFLHFISNKYIAKHNIDIINTQNIILTDLLYPNELNLNNKVLCFNIYNLNNNLLENLKIIIKNNYRIYLKITDYYEINYEINYNKFLKIFNKQIRFKIIQKTNDNIIIQITNKKAYFKKYSKKIYKSLPKYNVLKKNNYFFLI